VEEKFILMLVKKKDKKKNIVGRQRVEEEVKEN
jgi:hypothetical protein